MVFKKKQPIESIIKNKVYGHGVGWCFTSKDFNSIGTEAAIRKALSRLEKDGFIRRLAQGLYEYPRRHEKLGFLPPIADKIAKAISLRDHIKIQPSGAYAANLLGLSEQVPSRVVFVTDGASKEIKVGKMEIVLKKTTARNMANAETPLGLIIQALQHVGKDQLTEITFLKLKKLILALDEKKLQKGLTHAPAWIRKIILTLRRELNG